MFENSMQEAKKLLTKTNDKAHDIEHAKRVAKNASLIGRELGYEDIDLLRLCGWWHDVGRIISDEGHEEISATLLKEDLLQRGCDSSVCDKAYNAIVFHKWNMKPDTVEGNIIRDADKLDFISEERWKACLKNNQLKHLFEIKELLDQLPDFFKFEATRQLYVQRVGKFKSLGLVELLSHRRWLWS